MKATIRSLAQYPTPTEHDAKYAPMAHHLAGLTWTASGYGARIPTPYMVRVHGKWRRVYCRIYSNIGTCFIGRKYDGTQIVDIEKD